MGEVEALSRETTSLGEVGGLAEQEMSGDWKEWIDGELDPLFAPLGFDIQEGPPPRRIFSSGVN